MLKWWTAVEAWIQMEKIIRGEPLDHFFHQILFSHWSEALTCDQILDYDWRRGATAQLIPPFRRIGLDNYSHLWKFDRFFYFLKRKWKIGGGGQEEDVRKSGPTSFPVSFSKPRNYSHFWELDNLFHFITWKHFFWKKYWRDNKGSSSLTFQNIFWFTQCWKGNKIGVFYGKW